MYSLDFYYSRAQQSSEDRIKSFRELTVAAMFFFLGSVAVFLC